MVENLSRRLHASKMLEEMWQSVCVEIHQAPEEEARASARVGDVGRPPENDSCKKNPTSE